MKQGDLKKRIQRAAKSRAIEWRLVRQGGEHEVWLCGNAKVTIPRHREINEITAEAVFKALEDELGRSWWRK